MSPIENASPTLLHHATPLFSFPFLKLFVRSLPQRSRAQKNAKGSCDRRCNICIGVGAAVQAQTKGLAHIAQGTVEVNRETSLVSNGDVDFSADLHTLQQYRRAVRDGLTLPPPPSPSNILCLFAYSVLFSA